MKMLQTFKPENSDDTSITITASNSDSVFTVDNLKELQPVKSWKSDSSYLPVTHGEDITFDFSSDGYHADVAFINRINFAGFTIAYKKSTDSSYTTIETVTGLTTDEITDENYMKYWVEMGNIEFRYIKITIPPQFPLFENSSFKIGNVLFGLVTEVWTPKSGFSVSVMPKMSITEFGSGYISSVKRGRTRRQFNGILDKITMEEYNKLTLTFNPIVIYNDFESDKSKCYLVRSVKQNDRQYYLSDIVSHSFSFEEIV